MYKLQKGDTFVSKTTGIQYRVLGERPSRLYRLGFCLRLELVTVHGDWALASSRSREEVQSMIKEGTYVPQEEHDTETEEWKFEVGDTFTIPNGDHCTVKSVGKDEIVLTDDSYGHVAALPSGWVRKRSTGLTRKDA